MIEAAISIGVRERDIDKDKRVATEEGTHVISLRPDQ